MTLQCEVEGAGPALENQIAASLRSVTALNGSVTLLGPGALANDGKVIDDQREQG
jgi:phenylacetate-CoA ligase